MALWTASEIKSALSDELISSSFKNEINEVVIDSRKKTDQGLFIAINGENNDGHNFLNGAFENGAAAALVEKIPYGFENDSRLILVKNTLSGLSKLATFARNRSKAKIIAVTGSVGKTSVKEMLKAVFISQGKTFATSGNLNNHFGLPLSLANLPPKYDYGIFEMGMNHLGEIEPLSKMAKPHIAIITTIAPAHIGNFNSEEEIAQAKSEIFAGVVDGGFAIINNDSKYHDYLKSAAIKNNIKAGNIISFGSKETSDVRIFAVHNIDGNKSKVDIKIGSDQISYVINSINQTTIFNSLIIIACLKLIGQNTALGLEVLENLETPSGRGNLININKNNLNLTIIDDSYNANPTSMAAGLKFLSDLKLQRVNSRSVAIIGDMLELGKSAIEDHKAIAKYITEYNIDKVFLVGELMKNLTSILPSETVLGSFDNSAIAAEKIIPYLQNNDLILIKGSRGSRMEKIIEKIKEF